MLYIKRIFRAEVKSLFESTGNQTWKTFRYEQTSGLPEPVQRYLSNVLNEGQKYISYVRLKHDGQFKTAPDKKWMDIKGEQYFTTETPGFVWRGRTKLFSAYDRFVINEGKLSVFLLSFIPIRKNQGSECDQAELLRWLGESVWFPTNLLPSKYLTWSPIDSNTAKLHFSYKGLTLNYHVRFNDNDEIIQFETNRFMGTKPEKWIGKVSNYEEKDGIKIPMNIEAIWQLADGNFPYARFHIIEIDYNKPDLF